MTRPLKPRIIGFNPKTTYFKPRAVPLSALEEVEIKSDELEALRLCDFLEMGQAEAAEKMKVSQSTLQRVLASGRKKASQALVQGKAIKVERK